MPPKWDFIAGPASGVFVASLGWNHTNATRTSTKCAYVPIGPMMARVHWGVAIARQKGVRGFALSTPAL